jgi:hypothetical protein
MDPSTVFLAKPPVSGNFGEIRGGHFHAGIDFKTGGKEGIPILAASSGHVSRVRISSSGYGRVIYISHPHLGLTTIYGHLRAFYPQLEDSVSRFQYLNRLGEMEWFPDSGVFPVNQGQLIGFSGNTGSSQGPHLHFETRHTKSEKPFDPVLAGYAYPDTVPPVIRSVVIYQPGPLSGLAGSKRTRLDADSLSQTIHVRGNSFFTGLEGWDLAGIDSNKLGVLSVSVFLDDSLVFASRIDSFSFGDTRHVRAFTDYAFPSPDGFPITLCTVLPGNPLPFYVKNGGMMVLRDTLEHRVKWIAADRTGNATEKTVRVRAGTKDEPPLIPPGSQRVDHGKKHVQKTGDYQLTCQGTSFYEDVYVAVRKLTPFRLPAGLTAVTPVIRIGPDDLVADSPPELRIRIPKKIAKDSIQLIAVRIDSTGQFAAAGGRWDGGWFSIPVHRPGVYTVTSDTLPPVVKQLFWQEDDLTGMRKLVIPVTDNLSGVAEWECHSGDRWIRSLYCTGQGWIEILPEDLPTVDEITLTLKDRKRNQQSIVLRLPEK